MSSTKNFCIAISSNMKENVISELQNSKFISILSDGSTDKTMAEQEMHIKVEFQPLYLQTLLLLSMAMHKEYSKL